MSKEMTNNVKSPPDYPRERPAITAEDRIDDYAIERFCDLGYTGRLPDSLVSTYQEFKRRKDKMHPGPLTPDAFVTVLFLAGIIAKEF